MTGQPTAILAKLLPTLKAHEQRKYFDATLNVVAQNHLAKTPGTKDEAGLNPGTQVSYAVAFFHEMMKENELLKDHAVNVLSKSGSPALNDSLPTRRSLIAAVAQFDGQFFTQD